MKICSKCKEEKSFDEFNKKKNGKFGLNSWCRECEKEYHKEYRKKNKKIIAEKAKEYYENNKEQMKKYYENNKEQILEYHKEYYENNKEEILEKAKEYRENNKEQIAEYKKEYRDNNKEAIAEYHKEYYKNNKEIIAEYKKEYYENNKEKIAENQKEYYENNKEEILERVKEYYENNKEKIVEYKKEYYKNNPNILLNGHARRRQREKNASCGDGITKQDWIELLNSTNWKCFYCEEYIGGKNKNRTLDHIIPLCRGGPHIKENLVPACKSCNSSKFDKIGNEWTEFKKMSEERQNYILKIIDKYIKKT